MITLRKREIEMHETLSRAARLVERGWCQMCGATDIDGKVVQFNHPDARCFCLTGAINRAVTIRLHETQYELTNTIERETWTQQIYRFVLDCKHPLTEAWTSVSPRQVLVSLNDNFDTKQSQIVGVLKHAAEKAKPS